MGILRWFTHKIMGNIKEGEEIKDGVIIMPKNSEIDRSEVNEVREESKEWEIPGEYVEYMLETKKKRTVNEYCIDIRSFGVNIEEISADQIENRIRPLKEATKRRKITALKSYAKWMMINGSPELLGTLELLSGAMRKNKYKEETP